MLKLQLDNEALEHTTSPTRSERDRNICVILRSVWLTLGKECEEGGLGLGIVVQGQEMKDHAASRTISRPSSVVLGGRQGRPDQETPTSTLTATTFPAALCSELCCLVLYCTLSINRRSEILSAVLIQVMQGQTSSIQQLTCRPQTTKIPDVLSLTGASRDMIQVLTRRSVAPDRPPFPRVRTGHARLVAGIR